MTIRLRAILLLALAISATARVSGAQDLTVAAASDLQVVMPRIVTLFEQQSGRSVRVSFGSSGNFFSQIQNGAPFDVLLSADIDYPRQLEQAGLAEPGTLFEYATGRIVLWASKTSGVDVSRGLAVLTAPTVRHVAIANPEHAPYGRAAVAALRNAGVYDRVQSKLVLGENVSQAAQFVQSGNAEAGIVALSIALSSAIAGTGTYATISPDSHPPIRQGAIVMKASPHKAVALEFLRFLRAPECTILLQQAGFEVRVPASSHGLRH